MTATTPLPADWWPTPAALKQVQDRYPHLDVEGETRDWVRSMQGERRKNWISAWRAWLRPKGEQLEVVLDADWYPDEMSLAAAYEFLGGDVERYTQDFVAENAGKQLGQMTEFAPFLMWSDKNWTGVWRAWMRKHHDEREAVFRERELQRRLVEAGVVEHDRQDRYPLPRNWAPSGQTLAAATILCPAMDVEKIVDQFAGQFVGRSLESMEACDWIREGEATSWSAVWLVYLRQVCIARQARIAAAEKARVAALAEAEAVREQGGLRLLMGAAG